MKVIIAGGRDFEGLYEHFAWLTNHLKEMGATEVVCGMARGADMFGYHAAQMLHLPVKEFPADWNKFGKSAGYKRNVEMADYADAVILFPGGKGTMHMRNIAAAKGLEIIEYK